MWQNQVNCCSPNPRGRTTFAPLFPLLSTGGSQRLLCLFRVFQKASVVNGIEQILHYTRIFIATTRSFKYQNKLKTPQLPIITKTILGSWTIQWVKTEAGVSGRRLETRISHNASRKEKKNWFLMCKLSLISFNVLKNVHLFLFYFTNF